MALEISSRLERGECKKGNLEKREGIASILGFAAALLYSSAAFRALMVKPLFDELFPAPLSFGIVAELSPQLGLLIRAPG